MFKRGLSRLILWKRGRAESPNASEGDYERWLMALPMEYRDRIWIRGTPDMAERLEVRGCVIDASVLTGEIPERWKRINCVALCRSLEQLESLPEWVSGALIGPVFQPQSVYEPIETVDFVNLADKLKDKNQQVIAFGGIDHENLAQIKELPLQGISVLGGIWNYADPVNAFIKLGRACGGL